MSAGISRIINLKKKISMFLLTLRVKQTVGDRIYAEGY